MAKNSVTDYDTTAENNIDVGGIAIQGSADVANFDNALRTVMSHLKAEQTSKQTALDGKLPLAGGTMTGFITVNAAPTSDLHAASKKYVDDNSVNTTDPVFTGDAEFENISDGTTAIPAGYVVNGSAKAWCNFSQNIATINDSLNISSVTDDATGVSTVNFTTNFNAADYVFIGTNKDGNTRTLNPSLGAGSNDTYTVSAYQYHTSHDTVLNDSSFGSTTSFGDLA